MTIYALGDSKPQFPPQGEYWVAPNASVIGNVILHVNASVWFGAVLRGDNEPITVGPDTNIQDGSVLHTDSLRVLRAERALSQGDFARLIGVSRQTANALLTEGKVIPDNSLVVGQPGKVVRDRDPAQIAVLQMSAEHYVQNWKRFAAELRPL